MVVVLCDQLSHLRERILPALRQMLRDVWDFDPDNQTVFITKIIEVLIVLIVG